jgi:hypothetical protein
MRRSHRCHQVATPNGLPVAWPRRGFNTPAHLNIRSRGPRLNLDLSLRTTTETLQYIQFIYTYTSCIPAKHTGYTSNSHSHSLSTSTDRSRPSIFTNSLSHPSHFWTPSSSCCGPGLNPSSAPDSRWPNNGQRRDERHGWADIAR